jgi:hypothetical protein
MASRALIVKRETIAFKQAVDRKVGGIFSRQFVEGILNDE